MPNQSIAHNALLLTAADLLMRGVSMIFQVYLSGKIGAAGLGLLQLILSAGGLAMTLGLSGVRTAAMYLCAEEFGRDRPGGVREAMRVCLLYAACCSTAAAAILYCGSGWIAERWIRDVQAVQPLRLLSCSIPLNCISAVFAGYYTAGRKVRKLVRIEMAERLVSLSLTVFFLQHIRAGRTDAACSAILLGNLIAAAVTTAALTLDYRRDCRKLGVPTRGIQMKTRLFRLCLPLAANEYLRSGLSALQHFLIPIGLSRYGSSHADAMSAYGTIHGMVFPILMFPAAILHALSDLLVPELARCNAVGKTVRIRHLTSRCMKLGLVFSGAVFGLMTLLSAPLGRLIYHSDEVGRNLLLFAPMVLVLYCDLLTDAMCKGLGQQVANMRFNVCTSSLDVCLLLILLPRYGIRGYIFSFILTRTLNFRLSLRLLQKLTRTLPRPSILIRFLFCLASAVGAGLCVPVSLADIQRILITVPAFSAVYLAFLRLLGVLKRGDQDWLLRTFPSQRKIDISADAS